MTCATGTAFSDDDGDALRHHLTGRTAWRRTPACAHTSCHGTEWLGQNGESDGRASARPDEPVSPSGEPDLRLLQRRLDPLRVRAADDVCALEGAFDARRLAQSRRHTRIPRQLTGARIVQFRWEVFNVVNHVNFNAPVTALNSASFGQIQTAGDPRIMQFALKFTY